MAKRALNPQLATSARQGALGVHVAIKGGDTSGVDLQLSPAMVKTIRKARAQALKGIPGELSFQIEVKRANGTVEQHTLIGKVDGVA